MAEPAPDADRRPSAEMPTGTPAGESVHDAAKMATEDTLARSIDEGARRRFEAAWREGRPEPIERCLPPEADPRFLATLEELVQIEMEFTWKAGRAPGARPADVETYLERFPVLRQEAIRRRLLQQEYRVRQLYGDAPPARLGRFAIRQELGRGGYGIVYLAYDPQLRRDVALKVPRAHLLDTDELRARFYHEARAAAALDHPNLVPIYEAGAEGGVCYIASAYCPGVSLAAWLKEHREPVPERDAAALVAALADAVQHAHSRGILHRDLKPANILLQKSEIQKPKSEANSKNQDPKFKTSSTAVSDLRLSEFEFISDFGFRISDFVPKITDFGLAKRLADATGQTQSGDIVGTPAYMAPEQAEGRIKDIGTAADVYALGAVLYEVLAGRPPFQGETVLLMLEQVRTQEPPPLRRLRPKLPRDLETICLKCLQKDPARRYGSAAALADDLRRFLAGEPVLHVQLALRQIRVGGFLRYSA
jgi:serine/threonine protein kinase